jgi:hypothetical protein
MNQEVGVGVEVEVVITQAPLPLSPLIAASLTEILESHARIIA